jgi:endoglucanase
MKKYAQCLLTILAFSMVLLLTTISRLLPTFANPPNTAKITVNQVGYLPNRPKIAFLVNSSAQPTAVELVNSLNQKTVKVLQPSIARQDLESKDFIQTLDFSDINQTGRFFLRAGKLQSYPFSIAPNVYQNSLVTLLRSYYLQRCGVAINDPITGIRHAPCHLSDGVIAHRDQLHASGQAVPANRGWHDAGDYGKYIATTAISTGRLLSMYESNPEAFPDRQLSIPESGNGIPDLLDEMRVGLDWMLTMQRPDGAVYRKLSGKKWPAIIPPEADLQTRYLYGTSTPDTAKYAAAMALAARIYQPWQPEQAKTYLMAAQQAWQYLQKNSSMQVNWVNGDDSGSGKYLSSEIDVEPSLKIDEDDRLWAAAELFITTHKSNYEAYFIRQLPQLKYSLFEWKDPSALGIANYLHSIPSQNSSQQSAQVLLDCTKKIQSRAAEVLQRVNQSGYHLANHQFIWGSNKMTAEEGITLWLGYKMTRNPAFLEGAIDQIDFLLGRNPFNQSFVTGIGTVPVQRVHHIFARANKINIPGLLVGGPNSGAQDNIAPKGRGIWSYLDDERSYATNEYAIDYNASLIALMSLVANGN